MDQGSGQNKNEGFFNKYTNWVIGALLVIAIVIYFIVSSQNGNNDDNGQNSDDNGEQTQDQGTPTPTPTPTSTPTPGSSADNSNDSVGNVSATGTLLASDNASRGNLVVDSDQGKIYIATQRDFSSLIGKSVTLQADGTLNTFKFLGFKEAVSPAPTSGNDQGGAPEADATVRFSGKIQNSDNAAKGNYVIVSDDSKVYLKSVRDYSALIGSDVNLSANGTLARFTGAVVTKK